MNIMAVDLDMVYLLQSLKIDDIIHFLTEKITCMYIRNITRIQ